MFSRRTQWGLEENPLTLLCRAKRRQGVPLIDLTESNPTRCGLSAPDSFFNDLSRRESRLYAPDPKGSCAAREAVARFYGKQDIPVSPEQIVFTSGTSEASSHLFRLLCNPGESILIPVPSYPLFEHLAQLSDITLTPYHLQYDGEWYADPGNILEGMTSLVRGMILIHPHNPTGMLLTQPAWRQLRNALRANECPVIADEVFSAYRFADTARAVPSFASEDSILTFTLNGLSKLAGLPQMKLGWIVVSGPALQREEALERLEVINDAFLSVSTPIQNALPGILDNLATFAGPIQERIRHNLGILRNAVEQTGSVSLLNSEGGWNAILRLPAKFSDGDWCLRFLEEANILTHPGHFFDLEKGEFVVVSLLPGTAEFEEGITGLLSIVAQHDDCKGAKS